jgi:hypothetical protein
MTIRSGWKYWLILAVSLIFVAIGIFTAVVGSAGHNKTVAWETILFFGACAAFAVLRLSDRFRPPDSAAIVADRQKQTLERLAAAPIIDICGIVAPPGVQGGRPRGPETQKLFFSFNAWRTRDGKLQTRPMHLERQVNQQQFEELRRLIRVYSVLHIKARSLNPLFGPVNAILEEVVGTETQDAELNRFRASLNIISFEDPVFGAFILDRATHSYDASASWNGNHVSVSLSLEEETDQAAIQKHLDVAQALFQNQADWDRRIRARVLEILLPAKNQDWLEEGEAALTPRQFAARIQLDSVLIYADGSFEFLYDDGDIFYGHTIVVSGSLAEGPGDVDISG